MTVIEAPAPSSSVTFDVDAMLMYGWVADAERNVTFVSNSLRRWIRNHPALRATNDVLDRVETHSAGVQVTEFLASLLDMTGEAETPAMVDEYMQRLVGWVDRNAPVGRRTEPFGPYRVSIQYHAPLENAQPLAGARFVRSAATLLASQDNAERVDIVVVAIVKHDGTQWRVTGFQGQLQEAWIRVRNRIEDGNRSGSIALMARNLSHNIGSHALYWVAAGATGTRADEKEFLTYLQGRMELLAGFATEMPLSPIAADLNDVMARFVGTRLLLDNICRSESVWRVDIHYEVKSQKALFFGGELGIHAFYSILENCIRDSAKSVKRSAQGAETLRMHVVAEEDGDFIRIDVFDDSKNYARDGKRLEELVEGIRISSDSGGLEQGQWGIKERFICAAMLRGERPERFPQHEKGRPKTPWLGILAPAQKRILSVADRNGNCAWRFYLPRATAEVLLLADDPETSVPDGVAVRPMDDLSELLESPVALNAPFVVLDRVPDGVDKGALQASLPHRAYVRGDAAGTPVLSISASPEELSPTRLLQRSVEALRTRPVRVVLALNAVDTEIVPAAVGDLPLSVISEGDLEGPEPMLPECCGDEDLIVFKRHPKPADYVKRAVSLGVRHFETYTESSLRFALREFKTDPVRAWYRFVEAALTQILIIDERIDLGVRTSPDPLQREKLRIRGIVVRGSEFAGHVVNPRIHSIDELREWGRGFQYVLLHRGVADKLAHDLPDHQSALERIVSALELHGARVVMHSGRMGWFDLPSRTKLLSLTNVTAWIDRDYPKVQIVNELFSLRKV